MTATTEIRYGYTTRARSTRHHLTRTMNFEGRALCGVGYVGPREKPIAGYRLCRHCVKMERLDELTRELTAFESFPRLLRAAGNYRPTLRGPKATWLADAYDRAQAERGDERRAFRA